MHIGWTQYGPVGVVRGLDGRSGGPTSVRGDLMDYEEVQLAGDGELFIKSPYVTWKPEDTRIVTFAIGLPADAPARSGAIRQASARLARLDAKRRWGTILEENAAGDHVFFRVYKERK